MPSVGKIKHLSFRIIHRKEISWNPSDTMEQIEDYLRLSVIRIKQGLDWLASQPEVDQDNLGALGVSYGAIMHSILAAVDSRIKFHVLCMPAAPISDVIMSCPDEAILRIISDMKETYEDSLPIIHEKLEQAIVTDPLFFTEFIDAEKVQFYIALFDKVVGTKRSFKLWRETGKPNLRVITFGHYGGIMILPLLQMQTLNNFKRHLLQ